MFSVYPKFPYANSYFDSLTFTGGNNPALDVPSYKAQVLLIDDDDGVDYEQYYIDALDKIASEVNPMIEYYYYWDVQEKGNFNPADIYELNSFGDVIWFTGDADSNAISPVEQNIISDLINFRGRVCLTGKNIAQSLAGTNFLHDVLKINYVGNSTYVPRSVFGNYNLANQKYYTFGGDGANNQLYDRDILEAIPPAVPVAHYLPADSQVAGTQIFDGNRLRLMVLGFGIEGIRDNYSNYNNRVDLIKQILIFFDTIVPVEKQPITQAIQQFEVETPYPNPFNSSVKIEYQMPGKGEIDLKIYDILGRNVFSRNLQIASAGNHYFTWHGTDNKNRPVPSGIYFLQIQNQQNIETFKLFLIK